MMKTTITLSFFLFGLYIYGQKPVLTDTAFRVWPEVHSGKISNDGKYIYYQVNNIERNKNVQIIISANRDWQQSYQNLNNEEFSNDSKFFFGLIEDTLLKIDLKSKQKVLFSQCLRYQLYSFNNSEWLIYQSNNPDKNLIIQNLVNGKLLQVPGIDEYFLSETYGVIIAKQTTQFSEKLLLTDLTTGQTKVIYDGVPTSNHIFSKVGIKMAFVTKKDSKAQIWMYDKESGSTATVCHGADAIPEGYRFDPNENWRFSTDGNYLFFSVTKTLLDQQEKNIREVEIWNYKDNYLLPYFRSVGANFLHRGENLCILNIFSNKMQQLLYDTQIVENWGKVTNDSLLLIKSSFGHPQELFWNKASQISYSLLNTRTGKTTSILKDCSQITTIEVSPDNKNIIYFDPNLYLYCVYNILTQNRFQIKQICKDGIYQYQDVKLDSKKSNLGGIVAWMKNATGDYSVIIQGTFDLWKFNTQNNTSKCLTNEIGLKEQTIFLIKNSLDKKILPNDEAWILSGLNTLTKEHSIYNLDTKHDKLSLRFKTFKFIGQTGHARYIKESYNEIIKAKYSDVFLLSLGDVKSSNNLFLTRNFLKFDTISSFYPEKNYNWISSHLIRYKDSLNHNCEGVLYKPENFDPSNKYPVIFQYYLEQSDYYNEYLSPAPGGIGINIPLLVSWGYIVVRPNIYQLSGQPGWSVLRSVNAAVDYLKQFGWIDTLRMGITGHSLGGWETNYIISKTNRFAAAITNAGPSSIVDIYNDMWLGGLSIQAYTKGTLGMTYALQDAPASYAENSPISNTKNINTPLLLMHNELDGAVQVRHSKQLFIQLRSEQKPVWLIQYKGEGHQITNENFQLDYQKRFGEFFGFYLKGETLPLWMKNFISPTTY
jgi:dipeptidyl aminopeptidase/acylaminoacyl peptidase